MLAGVPSKSRTQAQHSKMGPIIPHAHAMAATFEMSREMGGVFRVFSLYKGGVEETEQSVLARF